VFKKTAHGALYFLRQLRNFAKHDFISVLESFATQEREKEE